MQRSAYEYTSPLNTYYNSNRGQEFDQNYSSFNKNLYPNDSKYGLSNFGNVGNTLRPDLYEGNNDNTLRAEERNWYIENHTNVHDQFMKNRDTLPRTSKDQRKEDDKKQEIEPTSAVTQRIGENDRLRRKEDRCSCECWPTGSPEATISDGLAQNNKSVNQSAVDMVASYGVYQNPHDDDDQSGFVRITNRSYPYQSEQQGIVVNEAGNCSVIPRPSEIIDNHQERSAFEKCCSVFGGRSNIPASSGQEVDCWVTCCKPAIFLFLLVLMLVVFALVSGLLVYFNLSAACTV